MVIQDLLKHYERILWISGKLDNAISKYSSVDSSDDDFFVYNFFHRGLLFGKSLLLLVNNECYHESVLLARNMLEGLFYFQAYQFEIVESLPRKWRLYGLYEDYWRVKEQNRSKLLDDLRKELGTELVQSALDEYDFNKRIQKWFGEETTRQLAKRIDYKFKQKIGPQLAKDMGMESLYDSLYHDFSQITHWTPTGVISGKTNINAALAVSFQCLHTMSSHVNERYRLHYTDDLNKVLVNFFRTASKEQDRRRGRIKPKT
jgi:hypothetical protein